MASSGYRPCVDVKVLSRTHSQTHQQQSVLPLLAHDSHQEGSLQRIITLTANNAASSPTYPTSGSSSGGANYTSGHPAMNDHFEIPVAKRQKVSGVEDARRRLNASPSALATKSPETAGGTDEPSPASFPALQTRDGTDSRRESESAEPGGAAASTTAAPAVAKPKRVRTGCLTCRNRHLKCDEAMPVCMNCQKSNRKCERGVRLNFIDLKVEQPPYLLPRVDWKGELCFTCNPRQLCVHGVAFR